VSSANFLVDSEAQLQAVIGAFALPPPDAVTAATNAPNEQVGIDLTTDPTPPQKGANTVRVKLTGADGKPVMAAQVVVTFFMPAMPQMGMAAMRTSASLAEKANGVYAAPVQLPSGGTWQVSVSAQRNGEAIGTRQLSLSATGGI
jgi:nitrogen fixation protein FixH